MFNMAEQWGFHRGSNPARLVKFLREDNFVQHGADIVAVKELLGRSTIVVTMRYAHSNDESKRRAVAKLSAGDSDKNSDNCQKRAS
jgi:hypothetical protein